MMVQKWSRKDREYVSPLKMQNKGKYITKERHGEEDIERELGMDSFFTSAHGWLI